MLGVLPFVQDPDLSVTGGRATSATLVHTYQDWPSNKQVVKSRRCTYIMCYKSWGAAKLGLGSLATLCDTVQIQLVWTNNCFGSRKWIALRPKGPCGTLENPCRYLIARVHRALYHSGTTLPPTIQFQSTGGRPNLQRIQVGCRGPS